MLTPPGHFDGRPLNGHLDAPRPRVSAFLDRRVGCLIAIVLLVTVVHAGHAEPVVRVKDGDSLVVSSGGREVDVRLADIDAPELRQPYGEEARSALQSLVEGREVELELVGGDAYRRIVARVLVAGLDVNAELVRRGMAWVRRAYSPAPSLIRLEDEARAAGRGLWTDADPVAPWIWRKTGKAAAEESRETTESLTIPNVECGTKLYCGEMDSCEEAIAHLQQCDLRRLDGDHDGIPCEKLCRYYR